MKLYEGDDVIYALATGWTKSALALIRSSGRGCLASFAPFFSNSRLLTAPSGTALFGVVGASIDEVVVTVYREGHGYTGEEAFELTCHGSLVVVRALLSLLSSIGFRQARRGEFTFRAFRSGRMDLTQAEAVEEMVDSMSDKAREMAFSRLTGALGRKLAALRGQFLSVMASIEVQLDYSEDELDEFVYPREQLEEIRQSVLSLASSHQVGKLYAEGAKVVLAGRTNVGKSSLFNVLLKSDRAIVSSSPGTTRDYLVEQCAIAGFPVLLYDTAGLRESGDEVEKEGIDRTRRLMEDADVIVFLREEGDELPPFGERVLPVWAKTDERKHEGLSVSAVTGEGVDDLVAAIGKKLEGRLPDNPSSLVIQSDRQYGLLMETARSLARAGEAEAEGLPLDIVADMLQEGLASLGEITGAVTSSEILEKIFSGFCVGK